MKWYFFAQFINAVFFVGIVSPLFSQRITPQSAGITPKKERNKEVVVATSEGTEFWVCFQRNTVDETKETRAKNITLELFISAGQTSRVIIEIDGLLFRREVRVPGGTVFNLKIDTAAQIKSSEVSERLAIHITADKPVSVYGLNHRFMTTDTYMGLPVSALGMEYRILSYEKLRDLPLLISQFAVIATEDSTEITIFPSTATFGGRAKAEKFTVPLKKGDVYSVVAAPGRKNGKADLTGTLVRSNKKIAVFGSHSGAYIPQNERMGYNHLVEQLPPISYWGRHYYVGMLAGCTRSVYRVLAAEPNTKVFANGKLVSVLQEGEFYEDNNVTENIQINADKKILVAQYSIGFQNGQGSDLRDSIGDPMMLLLTPTQQFLKKYRIATPIRGQWSHYFNLVVPKQAIQTLRVDGRPVAMDMFKPFSESRYMFVQLPVSYGTHVVECEEPIGLYSYGFGFDENSYDAYGNLGGQAFIEYVPIKDTLAPMVEAKNLSADGVYAGKLILRDDREDDKGIQQVRVILNDGITLGEAPLTAGAPYLEIPVMPQNPNRGGRALLEVQDVAGNKTLLTLCYVSDGVNGGVFFAGEGINSSCPSIVHYYAAAFGTFSLTTHSASFSRIAALDGYGGTFSGQQSSAFTLSSASLLLGKKLSTKLGVSARVGIESLPGTVFASDTRNLLTFDSVRQTQVPFQEASSVSLTNTYLTLALAGEWYFSESLYALLGIKSSLALTRSLTLERTIVTPTNITYSDTRSQKRLAFDGETNDVAGFVPSALAGVGLALPVWRRWSLAAEFYYAAPLSNVISNGSWTTPQLLLSLGIRYSL